MEMIERNQPDVNNILPDYKIQKQNCEKESIIYAKNIDIFTLKPKIITNNHVKNEEPPEIYCVNTLETARSVNDQTL